MFKGSYYNHQVAKAHPANIRVAEEGVYFEFTGDELQMVQMHWQYTEIETDHMDRSFIRLVNKADDGGTLEVNDATFVDLFLEKYKTVRNTSLKQLVLRNGVKVGLSAALIIVVFALLAHFYILPWCADRVVDQLPLSFDKSLGDAARESMHEPVDSAGSALLTKFAAQMKWDTPEKLTFSVVSSKIENAYALPGGYVVVYTGLLQKLQKKEQLAALLSHEIAHVTCRHSVRKLCRDMSTSILISVILSDASGAAGAIYSNANAIYSLTYSRQYEKQADIVGMETLRRNQIDQRGMLELMEALKKLGGDTRLPEFISTHPLTANRIGYVEKDLKENPGTIAPHEQMEQIFRQLQSMYTYHH
jgi:predicted Zn-dependent protease